MYFTNNSKKIFREIPNSTYKENLLKLNNFVMVKFDQDKTVTPRESQWFAAIQNSSFNRDLIILFSLSIYNEHYRKN